jgi:hypothetical protein
MLIKHSLYSGAASGVQQTQAQIARPEPLIQQVNPRPTQISRTETAGQRYTHNSSTHKTR